jgi:hypothetical protein
MTSILIVSLSMTRRGVLFNQAYTPMCMYVCMYARGMRINELYFVPVLLLAGK